MSTGTLEQDLYRAIKNLPSMGPCSKCGGLINIGDHVGIRNYIKQINSTTLEVVREFICRDCMGRRERR